jgi:hypothetical protein
MHHQVSHVVVVRSRRPRTWGKEAGDDIPARRSAPEFGIAGQIGRDDRSLAAVMLGWCAPSTVAIPPFPMISYTSCGPRIVPERLFNMAHPLFGVQIACAQSHCWIRRF